MSGPVKKPVNGSLARLLAAHAISIPHYRTRVPHYRRRSMRVILDLVVANRRSQIVRITDCMDCIKLAFHTIELVFLNTVKTQFLAFLLHIGIMV